MRQHTTRQYLVWMRFLENQTNLPSTELYYLMQIAAEIRRTRVKHPEQVKLDDMKIPFEIVTVIRGPDGKEIKVGRTDKPKGKISMEERERMALASRARWRMVLGPKRKSNP